MKPARRNWERSDAAPADAAALVSLLNPRHPVTSTCASPRASNAPSPTSVTCTRHTPWLRERWSEHTPRIRRPSPSVTHSLLGTRFSCRTASTSSRLVVKKPQGSHIGAVERGAS